MEEESRHHVLQVDDAVMHVDAWWLWRYAGDFLGACDSFSPPSDRFSPVPHYLVCRSIELSLKAFLFPAGFKKRDRRKLGHDLERALAVAEEHGLENHLEITPADRVSLSEANRLYRGKEFEYFESLETVYDPPAFDLDQLRSFAKRLLDGIEQPVRDSVFD